MFNQRSLSNGLTLITINQPHLDSVTTLVAVGAGSRYETKKISGISHFLEHMFFKGSKKYPTAIEIANLVDGIGAINNAATDKEVTYYWIKSDSKHLELSSDILSSMISQSLLAESEIEREKGVIIEELRMYRDDPSRYVWNLYERLQFGDQPLGWDIGGDEKTVTSLIREDFIKYMNGLYSPKNMALVYVGNLPKDIEKIAADYFSDLLEKPYGKFIPYKSNVQTKPCLNIFYKKTDQVNLILGVQAYNRNDPKKYILKILTAILGEGMSSRLFIQLRERRGLAYHVGAAFTPYQDSGAFTVYAGVKLEKVYESLEVIKAELEKAKGKVGEDELKKAKEMIRGRIAIKSESTNFLAEYFGTNFVLDRKIETFDEVLEKVDKISLDDVQLVANELLQNEKYNLQLIGPFKDTNKFVKVLG
ncbi:insulinase family protein [Candidatus Daviesbacteria bacterium]|nr:insulinase family protein [Candidatus Daviesbacteria bacterium]